MAELIQLAKTCNRSGCHPVDGQASCGHRYCPNCPILSQIEEWYHGSLDEAEYAADIVFRRQAGLQAIYGSLIRTTIHTVKPGDLATFLGKKLNGMHRNHGNGESVMKFAPMKKTIYSLGALGKC